MRFVVVLIAVLFLGSCQMRHSPTPVPQTKQEQKQQDSAELHSGLRWEVLAGVGIVAIGAAMMWYLGPKLGGGVAIMGVVVTFGSLTVRVIEPYWDDIVWSALVVGLIAAFIHFRKYIAAAFHLAHNTENLASETTKAMIAKIRAHGVPLWTKVRSLLHRHAPNMTSTISVTKP